MSSTLLRIFVCHFTAFIIVVIAASFSVAQDHEYGDVEERDEGPTYYWYVATNTQGEVRTGLSLRYREMQELPEDQ